jgi:hypothetical protein
MGARQRDIWAMVERLRAANNAEPCVGFPADPAGAAATGVYAFHADKVARELLAPVLGDRLEPLYVDQAGSSARRTYVASGATLGSAIARTHLRGSTTGSSFRRSVAAVLWDELDLHCVAPKRLGPESNARLTAWMLAHLRVATVVVHDIASLWLISEYIGHRLDPPFNLDGYAHSPQRERIRALRTRHFSSLSADDGRGARFRELRAFAGAGL